MRASPLYIVCVLALLSGAAAPLFAQPPGAPLGPPPQESGFSLHAHAFLDPERRAAVLVSIEIPHTSLIFLKKRGVFESDYAVYFKVRDKKKKIVETAVATQSVVSKDYESTRTARLVSNLSKRFYLPQGEYVVACTVEIKETQRVFQKEVAVTVPEFLGSGIGVGTPRLYAVDADTSNLVPGLVEASRYRAFEEKELETPFFAAQDRRLAVKFDVYAEEEKADSADCELFFEVVDANKQLRGYGRARVRIAGLRSEFAVYLDLDEWDPGSYSFVAKALQLEHVKETTSSVTFVVAYTKTMLTKHFDKTVAVLSLIATNDEIAELKNAKEVDRPRLWASFWQRRDPSPGTEENEALEEHLRRVQYAVDHFPEGAGGWESDRGKVYIKHGEPDHTEFKIEPQVQGEHLIWYYYEEGLRFVFWDQFGLREYRLTDAGQI